MGWKKGRAATPGQQMLAGNDRLPAKRSSATAWVAPNNRPSHRKMEITGREPSVHTNSQQTCRTAAAELTTPTAESGFNGDRNVTLLAPTSLSTCRQRWLTVADAGKTAVKTCKRARKQPEMESDKLVKKKKRKKRWDYQTNKTSTISMAGMDPFND